MIKIQEIKNRMLVRFENIKIANGYHTDLGDHVQFDSGTSFSKEELPALNFRFEDDDVDLNASDFTVHTLSQDVALEIITNDFDELFLLIADVKKAVGVDLKWKDGSGNALAITTVLGPSFRDPVDHLGNKVCDARLFINIKYRTKAWSEE